MGLKHFSSIGGRTRMVQCPSCAVRTLTEVAKMGKCGAVSSTTTTPTPLVDALKIGKCRATSFGAVSPSPLADVPKIGKHAATSSGTASPTPSTLGNVSKMGKYSVTSSGTSSPAPSILEWDKATVGSVARRTLVRTPEEGSAAAVKVSAHPSQPVVRQTPALHELPRFQPPDFEDANGMLPLPDSPGSEHSVQESAEILRPGTFVEYKSRSSELWILARVESFNESTRTYCLDVQPHAHADRVRPRGGGKSLTHELPQPTFSVRKFDSRSQLPSKADRTSCKSPAALSGKLSHESCVVQDTWETPRAETRQQLLSETHTLKEKVTQMESELSKLQEQAAKETALKDRYFAELCILQEKLRVSDPMPSGDL